MNTRSRLEVERLMYKKYDTIEGITKSFLKRFDLTEEELKSFSEDLIDYGTYRLYEMLTSTDISLEEVDHALVKDMANYIISIMEKRKIISYIGVSYDKKDADYFCVHDVCDDDFSSLNIFVINCFYLLPKEERGIISELFISDIVDFEGLPYLMSFIENTKIHPLLANVNNIYASKIVMGIIGDKIRRDGNLCFENIENNQKVLEK
jgi:hypothetical protein